MGIRERLRKLQRATERQMLAFELEDGTTARFHEDGVWPECLLHEFDRGKRHLEGADPGPAHPFVEALRNAAPGEAERLAKTQGTVILLFLGEDEIIRGGRQRPGASGPGELAGGLRVARPL